MAVRYFASSLLEVGLQNYSFNFNAINIVAKRNAFRLIIAMFFFSFSPLFTKALGGSLPLCLLFCVIPGFKLYLQTVVVWNWE